MPDDIKFTLLTKEEYLDKDSRNPFKHDYQLEVLKKHSKICCTDLVKLMGGSKSFWTKTSDFGCVIVIDPYNSHDYYTSEYSDNKNFSIRPVIKLPGRVDKVFPGIEFKYSFYDYNYVELGEYPQDICFRFFDNSLEELQKTNSIMETGRTYHINNQDYKEYKFPDGTKAIYYKVDLEDRNFISVNGMYDFINGSYVWVEVSPVKWLVDKTDTLISEYGLLSGVRFNKDSYDGNFENTEMYSFLNNVMFKDMFQDYLPKKEEIKEESKKDNILQMIRGLLDKTKEIKDENDKINIVNDLMSLARLYTDELIKIRNKEKSKYASERNLISEGILPYYVYIEREIEREISIDNKENNNETKEIEDTINNLINKASLINNEVKKLEILQEIEELRLSYLNNLDSKKKSYERIDFTKPLEQVKTNGEVKLTFIPPKPLLIRELVEKELEISKKINQELNNNYIIEELGNLENSASDIIKR